MGPRFAKLREQYMAELRAVKEPVNRWWAELVAEARARHASEEVAMDDLRRRWPRGPAPHPLILGVVRKYFFLCLELNGEIRSAGGPRPVLPRPAGADQADAPEADEPQNPVFFVGESLMSADSRDLAAIVGRLGCLPVGIDETGNYV